MSEDLRLLDEAVAHGYLAPSRREKLDALIHATEEARRPAEVRRITSALLRRCPVILRNLASQPTLNGSHGVCIGEAKEDRYQIKLSDARRQLSIRMANIELVAPQIAPEQSFITAAEKDDVMARLLGENAFKEPVRIDGAEDEDPEELPEEEALREAEAEAEALPRDADDDRSCRICMEDSSSVKLIKPCACRGTNEWACKDCTVTAALHSWLAGGAVFECKQCMQRFSSEVTLKICRRRVEEIETQLNVARAREAIAPPSGAQGMPGPSRTQVEQMLNHCRWDVASSLANYGRELKFASGAQRKVYSAAEQLGRACLAAAEAEVNIGGGAAVGDGRFNASAPEHLIKCNLLLGEICRYRRQLGESERLLRAVLEIAARPEVRESQLAKSFSIDATENLGNCLCSQERYAEGEVMLRRSLEMMHASEGVDSPSATQGYSCLAACLARSGGGAETLLEALTLTQRAAANRRRVDGNAHTKATSAAQYVLAIEDELSRAAISEGAASLLA